MSLLMDALKKAEQDKKEAARRLEEAKGQARVSATGEEDPDADPTGEHPVAEPSGEQTDHGRRSPASTLELSLEPLEIARREAEAEASAAEAETEIPAGEVGEHTPAGLSIHSPDETEGGDAEATFAIPEPEPEPAPDLDQTFHGVAMEGESNELFNETVQDDLGHGEPAARSYEETLPGVPAAQLARDIGTKDQPTPVAAETVFTATGTAQKPGSFNWPMLAGMAVVAVLAYSVFYYYKFVYEADRVVNPAVARNVERMAELAQSLPPPANAGPPAGEATSPPSSPTGMQSSGATGASANEQIPPGSTAESPAAAAAAAAMAETAPKEAEGAPAGVQAAPDTAAPAPAQETAKAESVAGAGQEQAAPPAPATTRQPAGLPEHIEVSPALIRISRARTPSEAGIAIRKAYESYEHGDFDGAKEYYALVLDRHPDNPDALQGMAAVALQKGDPGAAFELYAKLLKLDPKNETARAQLIAMQQDLDPLRSESTLKSLLHDDADNPFLNYTLGNVFAAQLRWADAQQAFFDAYRNDSTNADYALNLAVSLDHMGQEQTAVDYYNTALKLADQGPHRFDTAQVLARIQALSETVNP